MNECKQHFPVAIETETTIKPATGRFKAFKGSTPSDIRAPRITKVTKVKCFNCGQVIKLYSEDADQ